jgi:hypothetical protein
MHTLCPGRAVAAAGAIVVLMSLTAGVSFAAQTLPVLWKAGGLDAGTTGAGQAERIATDATGNVAVVSGPAGGRDLAITSYTANGTLRWRRTISPSAGTFIGDWIAAAANGDFVAVGHNVNSSGNPIAISMFRCAGDGTILWRKDLARTLPSVGRLLVDRAGSVYLAFNSVGDGQDIQLHKYSSTGVLLWSQVISTGFMSNDIATSLALSPDETDVALSGNVFGGAEWITAVFSSGTGTRRWLVTAPEGIAALDLVVDGSSVYVTGQGNVGVSGFLTVVAYDRATGARRWRTDRKPADSAGASDTASTQIVVNTASAITPPTNLTATAVTQSSVQLRWTNGTGDQTAILIERCGGIRCNNFAWIATTAGTATAYTDSGLSANKIYRYRARAQGPAGLSSYSNIAETRTLK